MKFDISDFMLLTGLILISLGVFMIHSPSSLIFLGISMVTLAIYISEEIR